MPDLGAIRQGLATRLATIPGVQSSAYQLGSFSPPVVWVKGPEIEYDKTFGGGLHDWTFIVEAFVTLNDDVGSQERLDPMLAPTGASSIKAAIEGDKTLGGVVQNVRVVNVSGYRDYQGADGTTYLGAQLSVHVMA